MLGTSNITTTVVANELGAGLNRAVSYLCKHPNINMWSKRKPVRLPTASPNRSGDWWKSSARNCGIAPTFVNDYRKIPQLVEAGTDWVYESPIGGQGSPYRLADFMEYNHKATSPISSFSVPSLIEKGGSLTGSCGYKISVGSRYEVELVDIELLGYNLEQWYFGMFVTTTKGGNTGYRVTSSDPIGKGMTCVIPGNSLPEGTYYCYPFLSSSKLPWGAPDVASNFVTVPNSTVQTVKVVSSLVVVKVEGVKNVEMGSLSGTVTVTNNLGTSVTFRNNSIKFRFAEKGLLDPLVAGEGSYDIPDFTLANGETKVVTRKIHPTSDIYRNFKIWGTIDSSNYVSFVYPQENLP